MAGKIERDDEEDEFVIYGLSAFCMILKAKKCLGGKNFGEIIMIY